MSKSSLTRFAVMAAAPIALNAAVATATEAQGERALTAEDSLKVPASYYEKTDYLPALHMTHGDCTFYGVAFTRYGEEGQIGWHASEAEAIGSAEKMKEAGWDVAISFTKEDTCLPRD